MITMVRHFGPGRHLERAICWILPTIKINKADNLLNKQPNLTDQLKPIKIYCKHKLLSLLEDCIESSTGNTYI